jgi:hypothetical protein
MSELRYLLNAAKIATKEQGTNVGREHINICCPFCNESKYHCGIHEFDLWFKCFVCGEGGGWLKIRRKLKTLYPSIPWDSINYKKEDIYLPDEIKKPQTPKKQVYWREVQEKDLPILEWLEAKPHFENIQKRDRERGLDLDIAFDAGLMIGTGKLNGYIVFKNGENINARKYSSDVVGPRWWKRIEDSPFLFGKEWVQKMNPEIGIITEGIFDCLRIPIGYGVAILGSSISENLIEEIVKTFENAHTLVLAMDRGANRNSITYMRLILLDMGYNVVVPDWGAICPKIIKDLDELFLFKSKSKFFSFIQAPHFIEHSLSFL